MSGPLKAAFDRLATTSFVDLDAEDQAVLTHSWQQNPPSRADRRAAESVATSLDTTMRARAGAEARRRYGDAWGPKLSEDLAAEMTVAALEALSDWDPAKDPTPAKWVWTKTNHALRRFAPEPGGGTIPEAWPKVAAAARQVKDRLAAQGRTVSFENLKDLVWEHMVAEKTADVARRDNIGGPEARRVAEERLGRKSVKAAIYRDDLAAVLEADLGTISLDAPASHPHAHDDTGNLSDLRDLLADTPQDPDDRASACEADMVGALLGGTGREELTVLALRAGETGGGERSWDEVARLSGLDRNQARSVARRAMAAVTAPHAQWCRLAPDVQSQFAVEPQFAGGPERTVGSFELAVCGLDLTGALDTMAGRLADG